MQLQQDFEKLLENAEEFVLANKPKVNKITVETIYFAQQDYEEVMRFWYEDLMGKRFRKSYALIDEILARQEGFYELLSRIIQITI